MFNVLKTSLCCLTLQFFFLPVSRCLAFEDYWTTKMQNASLELSDGKYKNAERLFKDALSVVDQDDMRRAKSLIGLAKVYSLERRFKNAIGLLNQVQLLEKQVPDSDFESGLNDMELSYLYYNMGNYSEAEKFCTAALAHFENVKAGLQTYESLDFLGLLYSTDGNYLQAQLIYEKLIRLCDQEDMLVAKPFRMTSVSEFYYEWGEKVKSNNIFVLAEKQWNGVFDLWGESLATQAQNAPCQSNIAVGMNALAGVYFKKNNFSEAEKLYRKALLIRENTLKPLDLSIAISLSNLARLRAKQNDLKESEKLYVRCLHIRKKVLGDNLLTAVSLEEYAEVLKKLGKVKEARTQSLKSLEIKARIGVN